MVSRFDVCIRGGGITGRSLALLLAREKLRVGLVARAPASGEHDVRAYALNAASRALLRALRAWPAPEHVTPVSEMQVWGDDGGELRFSAGSQGCEALNWIVDVAALEQGLADALHFQSLVERLDAPEDAALTVHCEGRAGAVNAVLGRELGIDFEVLPYPQHAIACRVQTAKPHGQIARQWFSGSGSDSEILAFLPRGGISGNSSAIVWSVPAGRAESLMCMEAGSFEQAIQEASHDVLGPSSLQSERARWPLQQMRASRWVGPGWALAGDAAHTVHPLSGQGLNLGLADVAQLALTLSQREYWRGLGDEKLLRRYERARKADVAMMAWATDGLQRLFAHSDSRAQALRNWGMKGFNHSGPFKAWAVRRAMGQAMQA